MISNRPPKLWSISLDSHAFKVWKHEKNSSTVTLTLNEAASKNAGHAIEFNNVRKFKPGDTIHGFFEKGKVARTGKAETITRWDEPHIIIVVHIQWKPVEKTGWPKIEKIPDTFIEIPPNVITGKNVANNPQKISNIGSTGKVNPVKLEPGTFFNIINENKGVYYKAPPDHKVTINVPLREYPRTKDASGEGGEIEVFFGTNRNTTGARGAKVSFGSTLAPLNYGICRVSFPRNHAEGKIERPFIIFPENKNKHVVLTGVSLQDQKNFFANLAQVTAGLEEKSAFIFIHGYNTTFEEAAYRTAQIAWDVPFSGIPAFFSWPSHGKKLSYLKDAVLAESSLNDFEAFVKDFISLTGVRKLHLIAHSMGSRLLLGTLNTLQGDKSFKTKLKVIHQLVLGAPDIDQVVFKTNILQKLQHIGKQRTLYSSDLDQALQLSQKLHMGMIRLGQGGRHLFVDKGLDTVDASKVKSPGNHHSYIFNTKELLTDLFLILSQGSTPTNRRLKAKTKKPHTYWLFK